MKKHTGLVALAAACALAGAAWGGSLAPTTQAQVVAAPAITQALPAGRASYADIVKTVAPAVVTVQVEGKVREIAPQADPATRLRRVRIALNNPPESFRLGTTVTAKLGEAQSPTLRVPASAVLAKDGANFIWVVDQPANTVSLHKVDLAGDPAGARVAGGLAPGARIVTAGIYSLKQGQQVRIEQDQKP
jgi:RND family efflux transporter MFP subunit